jgi:CHAD domain-containing protein
VDADGPLDTQLGAALESLVRRARKRCKRARRRGTPQSIHAARTSLRRAEAAIEVIEVLRLVPTKLARRTVHALHVLERAMGDARDDDILIATVQSMGSENEYGLREILHRLRRHRRRAFHALRDVLRDGSSDRTFRRARRLARSRISATQSSSMRPSDARPVLVRHRVTEALAHAFADILAYDTHLLAGFDDDLIHGVRARARTLRYILELFNGALPPSADRLTTELRTLQARLGELHDHAFAAARVRRWFDQGKLSVTNETVALLTREEKAHDRKRAGFAREWRALEGGFRKRLITLSVSPDALMERSF